MHIVLDLQACQSPESRRRGIGRYSLALAKAMASHSQGHDITVLLNAGLGDSVEYLRGEFEGLLPQSQIVTWDALVPVAYLNEANSFRRQASEVMRREVIRRIKPDVVHVSSLIEGLADDVVSTIPAAPAAYVTAATLYDLIPLAHEDVYLTDARVRRWYMEKIGYLRKADVLLGISRFSCEEAQKLLDIPQKRLVDISGAADAMFRPLENAESFRRELMGRYNLNRPFVMYAGGFDARKNIASLIRAFALLPDAVRRRHQLAIVGGAPEPERFALQKVMSEVGVAVSEVVFTGYVPDTDLVKLYNLCALYAFPSLQEGFGLPALEAMSSGAIVIGSNTSSLPEVIGHEAALFDPRDPQSIADKLLVTLTDPNLRDMLRRHGCEQPLKFSWQESARRAIEAFDDALERNTHRSKLPISVVQPTSLRKEKAAYLPAPGGQLKKRVPDTTVIYADSDCEGNSAQRPLSRFIVEQERFDRISIEVADHPYCAKTLPLAISGAVDLLLRGTTFGSLLKILATDASNRTLVHSLLYRSGGYPAILLAKEAEYSAEVLGCLVTADAMRTLGSSQIVEHGNVNSMDGGRRWRDYVQSIAAEIATFEDAGHASDQDWRRVASAISRDLIEPANRTSQWLVDISNLFVRDAGTGIQRVVRHVLDELIQSPPEGYRVEPVCLGDDGIFRYARSYCSRRYFSGETLPPDDPVEFAQGDVYLGLDLVAHLIPAYIDRFRDLRNRGVLQYFVVYDLLPILRPDCFEAHLLPLFRSWYEAVAEVADGVMCISQAVADEFRLWLDQARPERQRPLGVGYFHLGADLGGNESHQESTANEAELVSLTDRLTFLMVGTIEPRKGHAQVLGAFEQLWRQGREVNLLIIGKPGWASDGLLSHMRKHPERGQRFFWCEEASDDLLLAAYNRASALLMASEGEGFGLPLIEAAHHGLPLIVRDLPVFREIAEEHAHYFSGYEAHELAVSLDNWLNLYQLGRVPQSNEMRWITWQESARQLVDGLLPPRWLHSWAPGSVWRHAVYDYRFQTNVGKLARGRMETSGTAGLLLYGLPLKLHAGQYRVRLLGGWIGHDGSAKVEICSQAGTKTHHKVDLRTDCQTSSACLAEIDLPLGTDVSDLEIRISVDAHANLWISEVELHPSTFSTSSTTPVLAESQSKE